MPEPSLKMLIAAIVVTFVALAIGVFIFNSGGDEASAAALQREYDRFRFGRVLARA